MKLDQFRKMSEPWTWQTICDIQMLFDNGGNIETCDPFTFTLEAIDYDSQTIFGDCISAHITDASRRTYLENGLCNDIGNEDHCPEYFRTRYVEIYEHLQTEAKQVHKKPPIEMYCSCNSGNCKNCKCKKKNRFCNIWCHGGSPLNPVQNTRCLNQPFFIERLRTLYGDKQVSTKRLRAEFELRSKGVPRMDTPASDDSSSNDG